jgi:hypothetical protein
MYSSPPLLVCIMQSVFLILDFFPFFRLHSVLHSTSPATGFRLQASGFVGWRSHPRTSRRNPTWPLMKQCRRPLNGSGCQPDSGLQHQGTEVPASVCQPVLPPSRGGLLQILVYTWLRDPCRGPLPTLLVHLAAWAAPNAFFHGTHQSPLVSRQQGTGASPVARG